MNAFDLRPVLNFDDIDQCIELQRATWGLPEVDITPARLFIVARWAGTPPIGAFDAGGRLLGFVHTLMANHNGTPAFYSHMLAVDESTRDSGIGYRLKLAQREQAIAQKVPLVLWTYDPLQSRNAHFNLNKLGAIVRTYAVNFYGEKHASVFDAGIGSDRVLAEWWVGSRRVAQALSGEPTAPDSSLDTVEIPSDFSAVKRGDHQQALIWRLQTREAFQSRLSRGLVVVGLARDLENGRSRYRFSGPEAVADALR